MEPNPAPTLAEYLRRARQRRASALWLKRFARSGTWLALATLVAILAYERAQSQLSLGTRALAAAAIVGGAALWSAAHVRRMEPIARRVDRALGTGHLVETASEIGPNGAVADAPHPRDLCVRDAEQRIAARAADDLFPLPIPNFRWLGGLLAAILLSAFLPRLGFLGPESRGFGDRPSAADESQQNAASQRATLAAKDKPKNAKGNASAPASAPASSPAQPKPTSAPASKPRPKPSPPQSKPDPNKNDGKRPEPPKPQPIPPFTASQKIVPIDPTAEWRAKREALIVEVTQGKAPGRPDESPPAGGSPDAAAMRDLQRASEAALLKDAVGPRERAFARKFFEIWIGK